MVFRQLARLAPVSGTSIGMPGHQLAHGAPLAPGLAMLLIAALAASSFDGLNETFTWLGLIGINPLEFPGRSAVILPSLAGLAAAVVALAAALSLTLATGRWLAGGGPNFTLVFCALTPTLIPIAVGYHVAHYLTTALVSSQYAALALSHTIGGPEFYVTTGFFNTPDTVRLIWLTQASAIVIAHMLAVALAHAIALRLFGSHRKAVLSQLPMAGFMVAYTFLGLWILAQPTGA